MSKIFIGQTLCHRNILDDSFKYLLSSEATVKTKILLNLVISGIS